MKGTAKQSHNRFRIVAEIISPPVPLHSSNFLNSFKVTRLRKLKKLIVSLIAQPRQGVSTSSSGRCALDSRTRANASTSYLASVSHLSLSLNDGMEDNVASRCNNSRFIFHHCLLPAGSLAILSLTCCTCFAFSSDNTFAQFADAAAKLMEPSALFFSLMAFYCGPSPKGKKISSRSPTYVSEYA